VVEGRSFAGHDLGIEVVVEVRNPGIVGVVRIAVVVGRDTVAISRVGVGSILLAVEGVVGCLGSRTLW
jgi:hypothetical protein